jgi:hypothetical protein
MFQLSFSQKLELKLSSKEVNAQAPNKNLDWVVHHVPKTAGSSLRQSFVIALGQLVFIEIREQQSLD